MQEVGGTPGEAGQGEGAAMLNPLGHFLSTLRTLVLDHIVH